MREQHKRVTVLVADDDADDRFLIKKGWPASGADALHFVEDGEELMEYLHRRGRYAHPDCAPSPALILLDLNMPRKGGREVLEEIRNHPDLSAIPLVVLTTSDAEEDVVFCYETGANSYITKPGSFNTLRDVLGKISDYWLRLVELPDSVCIGLQAESDSEIHFGVANSG
jgi:two-component system, response regulator